MSIMLPLLLLLASANAPSSPVVTEWGSIDGVPIEDPVSVSLETADGRTPVWMATSTEPAGPRVERVSRAAALSAVEALGVERLNEAAVRLVWAKTPIGLRLSWIVDPPADLTRRHNPVFRVDATTGHVVQVADLMSAASARAYPENPLTTPEPQIFELTSMLEPGETLTHARFDVQSCQDPVGTSCTRVRHASADAAGDFLYEPQDGLALDDAFAETTTYVHAERFMDHMATLGIDALMCEENLDTRPILLTNYLMQGEPVENGYYTGTCPVAILLGQGEEADYAYDADVVYHELGHAVVHRQVPTYIGSARPRPEAWTYDAPAINEALADVLTAAFTGNAVIAESVFPRDIATNATCPQDLTGQQHNDSLPISAALWQLYLAWGDDFEPIVLDALTTLPTDVDYDTFAESIATVAGATLGPTAEALARAEFEATGVVDCDRVAFLEPGAPLRWVYLDAQLGLTPLTPPPLQLAIDVPAQTERVDLDYVVQDFSPIEGAVHVSWRWDEPVGFTYGGEDGTQVSIAFDDGLTDLPALGSLSIEPPSTDGPHRLHLAFSNVADGRHWVGVEAIEIVEAPAEEPESGSTGADEETGAPETTAAETGEDQTTGTPGSSSGGTDTNPAASDGGGCRVGDDRSPWYLLLLPLPGLMRARRVFCDPA